MQSMNDSFLMLPKDWLEWVTVVGYLSFAGFIAWRVLSSK
jgi:hypothetical protein